MMIKAPSAAIAVLPIAMVLSLFFSAIEIANQARLQFYFFHTAHTFHVEVFGPRWDVYVWFLTTLLLVLVLLCKRGRTPGVLIPLGLSMASLLIYALGLQTSAVLLLGSTSLLLNAFVLYTADSLALRRRGLIQQMIIVAGVILIPLELYSIAVWVIHPLSPGYPFDANPKWVVPRLVFHLFSIGYWLSAPALFLILTAWIWGPLARRRLHMPSASWPGILSVPGRSILSSAIIILIALVIGAFVAYYPAFYLSKPVGADSPYYLSLVRSFIRWHRLGLAEQLGETELGLILKNVVLAGEPHVPYILFLFLFVRYLGLSAVQAVQVGPIFLTILLVLSTFFAVREITGKTELGSLAAFLSASSSTVVVGMFYGIYANWLAMSLILLIVGLIMRHLRIRSRTSLLAGSLLAIVVGYTHPWTWAYFMLILLALAAGLLLSRGKGALDTLIIPAINIIVALTVFVLRPSVVLRPDPGSSWGEVSRQFALANIPLLLGHLSTTLGAWAASYYSNWIVLVLSLVGVLTLSRYGAFRAMMMTWLAVAFVGFALFTPVYEWRILYDVPFTILLSLGLASLLSLMDRLGGPRHYLMASKLIVLLVVVLSVLESGLRTMAFITF